MKRMILHFSEDEIKSGLTGVWFEGWDGEPDWPPELIEYDYMELRGERIEVVGDKKLILCGKLFDEDGELIELNDEVRLHVVGEGFSVKPGMSALDVLEMMDDGLIDMCEGVDEGECVAV